MAPLISIVIDNYNYARFLTQSIDSALAQSYANKEVIVVDDASSDSSADIIARYGDRVQAILQESNRGQGAAFNAGFSASRGDIVLFLDSDDWLYPHALQRVADEWQKGACKTHFRLDLVDVDGEHIDVHPPPEVRLDHGDVVPLLLATGRYVTPVTTGNAFARAALHAVMPIPEKSYRICADGYLVTVIPFYGPVITLDERLGAYRLHGNNHFSTAGTGQGISALTQRLRRGLLHDMDKLASLKATAEATGRTLVGEPWQRDPAHLEARLASIRLDPAGHPFRHDRTFSVAVKGVRSRRYSGFARKRQWTMAAWFIVVAVVPQSLAIAAIMWRFVPKSRSVKVDRWLKWLRRRLR